MDDDRVKASRAWIAYAKASYHIRRGVDVKVESLVYRLAVLAVASLLPVGAPAVASAEPDVVASDVIGKTFGEAKGVLGKAGMTPVVATVLGDRGASQDQCFVVGMTKRVPLNASGQTARNNVAQVSLNCYYGQSNAAAPGLSKGDLSPEAVAVRDTRDEATKKWKATAEGKAWCVKFEAQHPEWVPIPDCHSPEEEAVLQEAATKRWKASPEGQKWCAKSEVEHPEWGVIPDCDPPVEN